MHTIGKVFLVLVFLLAPAAALLTAKMMNVRNSWMQTIGDNQKKIAANDESMAATQREVTQLRDQLTLQRLTWDGLYVAPNGAADANGTLTVNVGTDQGFGVRPEGGTSPLVQGIWDWPAGKAVMSGRSRFRARHALSRFSPPCLPSFRVTRQVGRVVCITCGNRRPLMLRAGLWSSLTRLC